MKALCGIALSPGYAHGNVVFYRPPMIDALERRAISFAEVTGEFKRFCAALDRAIEEVSVVRKQVAADLGESGVSILDAHAAMLSDPVLKEHIHEGMSNNLVCAEAALADEMRAFSKWLTSSVSGSMRELNMDARDVASLLFRHLCLGEGKSRLAELQPHSVIFARHLTPFEILGMDRENVTGIATESGEPTSHTAILARALGIPAVTGLAGLLDTAASVSICLLDGAKGSLVLEPSDSQCRRFAGRQREFEQSRSLKHRMESKDCQLNNDVRIKFANIDQGGDVDLAGNHNLDGMGVYCTETEATHAKRTSKSVKVADVVAALNRGGSSQRSVAANDTDEEVGIPLEPAAKDAVSLAQEEQLEHFDQTKANTVGRFEASLDATQIYLNEIGYSPLMTADEEKYFSRLALQGNDSARRRMIESNLRLVVKISRRYINRGLTLLDLIQEGNLGLIRAFEQFDPEHSVRFSTYATRWVRQSIERGIMNQGCAERILNLAGNRCIE